MRRPDPTMLDFGELMLIGAVALVVLGPERLPRVARAFGEMVAKAQRYVSQVRVDFQREIELAEVKRLQEEARQASAALDASVRDAASSLSQAVQPDSGAVAPPVAPPDPAPDWSDSSWGSHRFHTRARPGPSLTELIETVEQIRGRVPTGPPGRIGRNRYARRARVSRPRIHR